MIYWSTESIGSSFLPYYDYANANTLDWIKEGMKKWTGSSNVPAAFALFPKDISQPPREWAERFFHVQRWTEMPRGGHFAAMEEPQLLAEDIRAWFRAFRDGLITDENSIGGGRKCPSGITTRQTNAEARARGSRRYL